MLEYDYKYIDRIREYARRKWEEPRACTFIWDKYGIETDLVNRQHMLCRTDVDYAYDEDYNLRIINKFNTTSPFINQRLTITANVYNEDGELETGELILYLKKESETEFKAYNKLPLFVDIQEKEDFQVVTKYYFFNTEYPDTINPEEEYNISEVTNIHVKDYADADYFVAEWGYDTNPGTETKPFMTIQHAIDVMKAGDTICILTELAVGAIVNDTVLIYKDCNIIGKYACINVYSKEGWFLTILPHTNVYIQNISFIRDDEEIYNYSKGAYISNEKRGLVSIESPDSEGSPDYNFNITSTDYWIGGETISIQIKDNYETLTDERLVIFNSLNEIVYDGSAPYIFKYTIPYGLDYDSLTIIVIEHNYIAYKRFPVYNINADWYVDTNNGNDDLNSGKSLNDPFKTLNHAIEEISPALNHIFFRGTETVNNINLPYETYIRGLKNSSVIKTIEDYYFSVDKSLTLSDLIIGNALIDNTRFDNNQGHYPLKIRNLVEKIGSTLFVDGLKGDDNNMGTTWGNALKTLAKAVSMKNVRKIYFSGENHINTSLHIYEDLQIIGTMNKNVIISEDGSFFKLAQNQVLEISNLCLQFDNQKHNIEKNIYETDYKANLEVYVFDYDLEITSDDAWIFGEYVTINIKTKYGTFPDNKTIKVYNSKNELINTSSKPSSFKYKVPTDITKETITAKVIEDNYSISKTFSISKLGYELDIISNDRWVNEKTVNISIILKSGAFPTNRTIKVYNMDDDLIQTLSKPGTFKYTVPKDFSYDEITVKVVEDDYSITKNFDVYETSYELDLISYIKWFAGETVEIRLIANIGEYPTGKNAYIYNSKQELIDILDKPSIFEYTVPTDLSEETLMVKVIEDSYFMTKTFSIEKEPPSVYYVNTTNGNDANTGDSLETAFKTLNHAFSVITTKSANIYVKGNEETNNLAVSKDIKLNGFKYEGLLNTKSSYFNIEPGHTLELENMVLGDVKVNNTYINNGTAGLQLIKIKKVDYELGIKSYGKWSIGEAVFITVKLESGTFPSDRTIKVYNKAGTLIKTLSKLGGFDYDVPSGISEEKITVKVVEDEYTVSKTFPISQVNYNLEIVSFDDWIMGETVEINVKLNSGTFPDDRTIKVYNHSNELIGTLSKPDTVDYIVPSGITEETITAKVIEDDYSISKTFTVYKGTYKLDLISSDKWYNGETVKIELIVTEGTYPTGDTIKIYNSAGMLIEVLEEPSSFDYTVPEGITKETLLIMNDEDGYKYAKTFPVEQQTLNEFYVDTVNGNDSNTGASLDKAFKTLEHALSVVTIEPTTIYITGTEKINNLEVSKDLIINGLNYEGYLTSDSYYFDIKTGHTLQLVNVRLETASINNTYDNNGTEKLKVIKKV